MRQIIFFLVFLFSFGLLLSQTNFQKGDPVYAQWQGGAHYKATIIRKEGENYEVQWQDGSSPTILSPNEIKPRKNHGLDRSQIGDWDITDEGPKDPNAITLWEVLPISSLKAGKAIYAKYLNGLYYKAFELETKGKLTLVRWEDNSGEMWVDSVKPRKGHGLTADLIGDRELTAAEKAANQRAKETNAAKYEVSCSKFRTRMDCMRSLDPCAWNDRSGCSYRGY
ncbi:MAG: hypothetical protein MUF77_01565 [Leptospira sp.]|jgi:hypothetical protein|nr:hypothetical protein [Leptospira sp.]